MDYEETNTFFRLTFFTIQEKQKYIASIMDLNYFKIILDGFTSIESRKNMGDYLFRKYKEAEKKHYQASEFFDGCEAAYTLLSKKVTTKYNKQKKEFYELQLYGSEEGKEYATSELKHFAPDNYPLNLSHVLSGYTGHIIRYSDLTQIESGILKAKKKAQRDNEAVPLQTLNPQTETPKYTAKIESVITTITESCVGIIADPEQYCTLKKHFEAPLGKQRENHRTGHIINKSNDKNKEFKIENQHLTGQSETKNSTGTIDFAVFQDKEKISVGEALNSSAHNTNRMDQNIVRHLKKLIQNYNYSTLSDLIFLVYYEGTTDRFHSSYLNYLKHFVLSTETMFHPTKSINDISKDFVKNSASIKIAKSIHSYSDNGENEFSIYHFYIDFSEK